MKRAGGYYIGFYNFFHMKKAGGYQIIHPCTFQMSRKPPPCLTFSTSHQKYTTNFTLDYYNRRYHTR